MNYGISCLLTVYLMTLKVESLLRFYIRMKLEKSAIMNHSVKVALKNQFFMISFGNDNIWKACK